MSFNNIFEFLKAHGLVLIPLLGLIVVVLIYVVLVLGNNEKKTTTIPSPLPIPTDLSKDYSNLRLLEPGKSTRQDVERLNGKPVRALTFTDKTYLYYPTPLSRFENAVLLENNKVLYAKEYVFGPYRGTFDEFQSVYGSSFVKMFQEGEPFTWFIYLDKGLGIESDEQSIGTIIYFVPMSKEEFLKKIAPDLRISDDQEVTDE